MGLFNIFKKEKPENTKEKSSGKIPEIKVEISSSINDSYDPDEGVIPIEKRIDGQEPTCDGLYPHEVLALDYAPGFYTDENNFQGFWWYKYGIKDVQKILDSLCERGYTRVGSIESAINAEKMPLIKETLKKYELKVSGKKAELVARLLENVPEDDLEKVFTRHTYELTEKGETVLKAYEWIPYIHHHREIEDLDIWNLTDLMQTPPKANFRDKIWRYLNQRGSVHMSNGDFGLYRNSRFEMAEFVEEEGKHQIAFSLLCEVLDYDLSGLQNNFDMQFLYIYARHFFPYEKSTVKMAPGITSRVEQCASAMGWTQDELRDQLLSNLAKFQLPFRLFSDEEIADIVIAEIQSDKVKLNEMYTVAEKRFQKKYNIDTREQW